LFVLLFCFITSVTAVLHSAIIHSRYATILHLNYGLNKSLVGWPGGLPFIILCLWETKCLTNNAGLNFWKATHLQVAQFL